MVRTRTIAILVAVAAAVALSPVAIPVLGFQYTFWRINQMMDRVPESELIDRTKDLPEVRAFVEKYENARTYIDTDFHVAVVRAISECELTGRHCNEAHPNVAYLDVRISLDTGYPERSIFWCGNEKRVYSLSDGASVEKIKDC